MKAVQFTSKSEPVKNATGIAKAIISASDDQVASMAQRSDETIDDLTLSTDTLNFHRVEWRLLEEWGVLEDADHERMGRVKSLICKTRGYDTEEFEAALIATRSRARLPFGWSALDLAAHRLKARPIHLLDEELEASRYAKGVMGLAIHLQLIQKDEPILLPVEQVREILKAKKVVIAGTITKLVEMRLLELTKADYHTGSAREFKFRGVKGTDYVFIKKKMTFDDL